MKLRDTMVLSFFENVMSSPGDLFARGEMDRYKRRGSMGGGSDILAIRQGRKNCTKGDNCSLLLHCHG